MTLCVLQLYTHSPTVWQTLLAILQLIDLGLAPDWGLPEDCRSLQIQVMWFPLIFYPLKESVTASDVTMRWKSRPERVCAVSISHNEKKNMFLMFCSSYNLYVLFKPLMQNLINYECKTTKYAQHWRCQIEVLIKVVKLAACRFAEVASFALYSYSQMCKSWTFL